MANRVRLCKNATTGAQPSIRIRAAKPPFLVASAGGGCNLEHTMDGPATSDAAATWTNFGTIASGDQISITTPLYRVRANVTSGTATVDLLEYRGSTA